METQTCVSEQADAKAARAAIARAWRGEPLGSADAVALISCPEQELSRLLKAASRLRDRGKGRLLTYSPKVFLPVTNLCRDRCTYCTFRKEPDDPEAWTMTREEIADWSRRGRELGCREALVCLGDKPERAYPRYRQTLAELGVASTIAYVREACAIALEAGLLPHTNAGLMSRAELELLRPVNASMGLMLENISPRLRGRGQPHQWAPDKTPALRVQTIEWAGQLSVPFTTGILVGIGETLAERAESLLAIRDLHARHGHIQEVIIQNFRAKSEIAMAQALEPQPLEMARAIATARLLLGPAMNIQAPPNLSPDHLELFLAAGVNDWGGISPLTSDFVNPEAPWPHLAELRARCARAGFELRPRLPVYPEYIDPAWIDPGLTDRVRRAAAELRS